MKRGDIVVAAAAGNYGKPRPHIVVQSDRMQSRDSVILCPITTKVEEAPFRLPLQPNAGNGLRDPSDVMVDKLITVRRERVARAIGRLTAEEMRQVEARLALVLGLRG